METKRVLVWSALVATLILAVSVTSAGTVAETASAQDCGFPYTTTDGTGEEVTLDEEPDRIVSLGAPATQTLWEMGSDGKVVGSDRPSLYLTDERGDFEVVTGEIADDFSQYGDTAVENTLDLDADLVVINGITAGSIDGIDGFGGVGTYRSLDELDGVYVTRTSGDVDDITRKVENIGRVVGNCEGADETVEEIRESVGIAERTAAGQERPGFVYAFDFTFFAGPGSHINDVVETAGGENVLAENIDRDGINDFGLENPQSLQVSEEVFLDPEVNGEIDWIVTTEETEIPDRPAFQQLDAVQEDRVIRLDPNEISQDAPRVRNAMDTVSEAFFPDARESAERREDRTIRGGGGGSPDRETVLNESRRVAVGDSSPLEVSGNESVAEFVGGPVASVTLDGEFSGEVSVEPFTEAETPGTFVTGATVDVPDEASGADGRLTFSVDSTVLSDAGVSVGDLHVAKDGSDGWNVLETDRAEVGDEVLLEARTTFSDFSVVASSSPDAVADVSVQDGTVALDASASTDEYGEITRYVWEIDGDTYEGETVGFEAEEDGEATLTVTNDAGLTDETTVTFSVGDGETEEGEDTNTEDGGTDGETETGDGDGDGSDGGDGSEGLPGFTAVVALVAVLALVAVRARQ
ncbi:MAG: ABC transporter substrate-binding protein [Halobacteriales archaeon]|nr:ABC transporter substrate-binding protein [Halobacteriales archaeon]